MGKPIIQKPSQLDYVKALIMGDPGSGKTTFLGTAQQDPRTNPMIILDFEGGTSSLRGLDIDVIQIRSWEDYDDAYRYLSQGGHPYKSVAIDSGTETHVFALLNILDEEEKSRKARDQQIDALQQADYGRALIQMRRLLRAFRDLPMHVFITALTQDVTVPGLGTVKKPAFAGRLTDEIPGLMNIVAGYSYTPAKSSARDDSPEQRVLYLKNHPRWMVKVRTPWGSTSVPDGLLNPTMTKLLDALEIGGSGVGE